MVTDVGLHLPLRMTDGKLMKIVYLLIEKLKSLGIPGIYLYIEALKTIGQHHHAVRLTKAFAPLLEKKGATVVKCCATGSLLYVRLDADLSRCSQQRPLAEQLRFNGKLMEHLAWAESEVSNELNKEKIIGRDVKSSSASFVVGVGVVVFVFVFVVCTLSQHIYPITFKSSTRAKPVI